MACLKSLIFNSISECMQIRCNWSSGTLSGCSSSSSSVRLVLLLKKKWRRLFTHRKGGYLKALSPWVGLYSTKSQPIYSEWIRSSVHYNSPEFLTYSRRVVVFCCSLLFNRCAALLGLSPSLSKASHLALSGKKSVHRNTTANLCKHNLLRVAAIRSTSAKTIAKAMKRIVCSVCIDRVHLKMFVVGPQSVTFHFTLLRYS